MVAIATVSVTARGISGKRMLGIVTADGLLVAEEAYLRLPVHVTSNLII